MYKSFEKNKHQNKNNRNTSPIVNKGINFTSIYSKEIDKYKLNNEDDKKEELNDTNIIKEKEKMFNMLVKEAKFNNHKVGYVFNFKNYTNKEGEKDLNGNNGIKDLIGSQENMKIYGSEMSSLSFNEDIKKFNLTQKAFNLNLQNNDSFFKNFINEKENQFTFDAKEMTYKQFKYSPDDSISFYEILKEEAIKTITSVKNQFENEESEEEEESSESEYNSDEHNSNDSFDLINEKDEQLSKKDETQNDKEETKDKPVSKKSTLSKKKTLSSQKILKNENSIKNNLKNQAEPNKKEEDFYHVNFNKISYYVFNYTSGFAELQKGNYKISHITYLMNAEKEKIKHSNSKFLASTKFMKGRKKGNTIKKEEGNEINPYSFTSMKLKQIYRALSDKGEERSIIKMFLYSIIIFALIVGTGIMAILIFNYLKNTTYSFYILIQKSDNLYQNLLFEITLVREMVIIKSSYYNNTLISNKNLYYKSLTRMIYNYYRENAFIISNLTNNLNILNQKDQESIINKEVELFILDNVNSRKLNYQYKNYKVLVYSAYRELNSALYHISKLTMNEIYHYQDDVYYFIKNGMSNLLISSEEQMWTLTEKFEERVKYGHAIIIICCAVVFVINCLCFFISAFFYGKVNLKKQKYLSILNKLNNNLIISSLQKCEKFSKKLQDKKETKDLKQKKISLESSSFINSEFEYDNISFLNDKKNKIDKLMNINNKKDNYSKCKISYIFQIILFLALFSWQLGGYIYYYQRLNIYKKIVLYEYFISLYASNFLYEFISLREYIFDKNFIFYNQTVDEYVNETLANYYVIFQESAEKKDKYRVVFQQSFQDFLNYLHSSRICEFINNYNRQFPGSALSCTSFFYGTPNFGYFTLLTSFNEELRMLRDKIDNYLEIAQTKNFTYNETYLNDLNGYYDDFYEQYNDNMAEYRKYNPAKILNTDSHKRLLISFLYINIQVYNSLITESLKQYVDMFDKYNLIYLIINIVFLIVVGLGFIFVWTPFIFGQNKEFYKIKNMLSIIPSELLMDLPDINILLEIDEQLS